MFTAYIVLGILYFSITLLFLLAGLTFCAPKKDLVVVCRCMVATPIWPVVVGYALIRGVWWVFATAFTKEKTNA